MIDNDLSRPITGALSRFSRDLTADARAGRLEIVRARDGEISRVIDILLRHGKNNPALVGPAGVGKTAIAEGLAARLATGDVPLSLRNTKLLAVDHVSLLAGTTYRGQYEERIRALVEETRARPDVILFVDELHNLIGQGTAMGVAMDAANMLKPALVRGDFRVIGATTDEEYDRWVRADPALERRFQRVLVRELSSDETLDILRARQERLERHHNVLISDESIRAAVDLTDIHQTDRRRPDRAIDVLDEACAHTHAIARYSPRAETLIRRRRELLREQSGARESESREEQVTVDNTIDSGMAALEQFGAELEAIFIGPPPGRPAPQSRQEKETTPAPQSEAVSQPEPPPATLGTVETELAEILMEEGIVVRGIDVARVVAVATGREVTWAA
ncbi:MAG TPA: AAA family ATPase [Gemmatimonadaceae bacterium]